MNPHLYSQLIYNKGGKTIQWEKTVSIIDGVGNTGHLQMKLYHFLIPYTKINSKWIKGLNVGPETIKLLGEKISSKLFYIILSNIF